METFIVRPEDDRPSHSAVILYMDAPGVREELYQFCRHIAEQGYYVLLPDLYYRLGKISFDYQKIMSGDVEERQKMSNAKYSLSNQMIIEDTGAILEFLAQQSDVKQGPKGCIGYCMSGQFVMSVAASYPNDFAAVASLYGENIVTDKADSPHLHVNKIKGTLYLGFAENDRYVPASIIPVLREQLDLYKINYTLDIFPNTQHGFCFPARIVYAKEHAETVWQKVFALYKKELH